MDLQGYPLPVIIFASIGQTVAIYVPACLINYALIRWWDRRRQARRAALANEQGREVADHVR